jgi:hypothetical protein
MRNCLYGKRIENKNEREKEARKFLCSFRLKSVFVMSGWAADCSSGET